MAEIKAMVEYVARKLVDDPNSVYVSQVEGVDSVLIDLRVGQDDVGRVIGRHGRHINAMRTLARVLGAKQGKRVRLEIIENSMTSGDRGST